jgi:tRNA-Thr(GGU) m(6)t(6)A37 methyltransferase TsaA
MNTPTPSLAPVSIQPIGVVESAFHAASEYYDYAKEVRIHLNPELQRGLVGIEYFSHLWVIYSQHRSAEWLREKGWGDQAPLTLPLCDDRSGQGVFSSRAPCRPAALGSCIVELVRREGAILIVRGLDAFDGTPVLDVKPYVPQFDAFPQAIVPLHWARVMERSDDATHGSREFHWDTTNVEFVLGLRCGVIALASLEARRSDPLHTEIEGSAFFAQGWEAATGCSPLRGTLVRTERALEHAPWRVQLASQVREISYFLPNLSWADAAEVMAAPESALLQVCTLTLGR